MTAPPPHDRRFDALAERLAGLTVEQGRRLYDSLSAEEQTAMDERGLKRTWAAMKGAETRRRNQERERQRAMHGEQARRRGDKSEQQETLERLKRRVDEERQETLERLLRNDRAPQD
ncbi:MAG TPA: hypothetical protein VK605_09095 [Solirubrobacteraceae bacterium]|nr:hypothetical protein [Solirubrobacteraceae bacterium]